MPGRFKRQGWVEEVETGVGEGGQKLQTSGYKISSRIIIYSMVTSINSILLYT